MRQYNNLKKNDLVLSKLVCEEIKRQKQTIDLIASENIVSESILETLGSPLVNKYSEGYPGKRYYPGNFYYDKIEKLAQERALKLFNLSAKEWHVNVQSYSGSPANMAVYFALIELGDTLMGMSLSAGGHLTHGHKVNFSGKNYKVIQYGTNEKGFIDYDEVLKLAQEHKPKIIISGATAYPRKIDFDKFGKIARKVGAFHLADISHVAGLIATKQHPSPFPFADVVMTTTHKTLRGPRGAVIFCKKELAEKIDKAVFPGLQGGPHNNITAAKALCFQEALNPKFKTYQKQIIKNAKTLATELKKLGFNLVSGDTDNHLILIDLRNKNINGLEAERALEKVGIIANRNSISSDASPFNPSGIRLGTPAVTSRGMKEKEMKIIAKLINDIIGNYSNPVETKKRIIELCKKF